MFGASQNILNPQFATIAQAIDTFVRTFYKAHTSNIHVFTSCFVDHTKEMVVSVPNLKLVYIVVPVYRVWRITIATISHALPITGQNLIYLRSNPNCCIKKTIILYTIFYIIYTNIRKIFSLSLNITSYF